MIDRRVVRASFNLANPLQLLQARSPLLPNARIRQPRHGNAQVAPPPPGNRPPATPPGNRPVSGVSAHTAGRSLALAAYQGGDEVLLGRRAL
jgi:hypothetical protein